MPWQTRQITKRKLFKLFAIIVTNFGVYLLFWTKMQKQNNCLFFKKKKSLASPSRNNARNLTFIDYMMAVNKLDLQKILLVTSSFNHNWNDSVDSPAPVFTILYSFQENFPSNSLMRTSKISFLFLLSSNCGGRVIRYSMAVGRKLDSGNFY